MNIERPISNVEWEKIVLRSGTSPYPNHGETQAAESPKDVIHKFRVGLKELMKLNCGAERHYYSMFSVERSMFDVRLSKQP